MITSEFGLYNLQHIPAPAGIEELHNGMNEVVLPEILPGSRSKLIKTDGCGKIAEFKTTLTGEMIWALSQETILRDAIDLTQSENDKEYLIKGYEYCVENGLNEALFKTRILKNIFRLSRQSVYSFFIGAILQAEIHEIVKAKENKVIIAGKKQIKTAMVSLLNRLCDKKVTGVSDETAEFASAFGAVKIYEYKNNI